MTVQVQPADIFDVQVQFIRASGEAVAKTEQEFRELMPGWSMAFDYAEDRLRITPPAHVTGPQRQVLDAMLAEHDVGALEIKELMTLLRECCSKHSIDT